MARPRPPLAKDQQRSPALTGLLVFTLVFQTLIAVWAFTHFGAGASSLAVRRFPEWGAEGLMVIAASTASCAWFTLQWKRWAAWGLLGGLSLEVAWFFLRRPLPDGVPSGLYTVVLVLTVGAAIGLWLGLARIWPQLERS